MSDFINAYRGHGRTIVYEDSEGARLLKKEGSPAWRNNNPGNMESRDFAKSRGAIGDDGRFAVFPNYDTGRKAMESLLKTESYKENTLEEAINRYAPNHENDTNRYIDFIKGKASIRKDQRLRELTDDQFKSVADAIERFEGYIQGEEVPIPRHKPVYDATGRMIRD